MTQILIVGATSAMARGCAYAWAKQGQRLVLAGRDLTELERIASDIRLRFASNVQVAELDLDNAKHLSTRWSDIEAAHGDIDGVLMAAGCRKTTMPCAVIHQLCRLLRVISPAQ